MLWTGHRIGFIEKAGTGIRRMREGALAHGCREPVFVGGSFFTATFWPLPREDDGVAKESGSMDHEGTLPVAVQVAGPPLEQVTGQVTGQALAILIACRVPMGRSQLQTELELTGRAHFTEKYLRPLLMEGLLEMLQPESPRSPHQRYRATAAGLRFLAQAGEQGRAEQEP